MRRETIGPNYSGYDNRPRSGGGGLFKFKYLLIIAALCLIYLIYTWVTSPAYAPGFVRDILPNTPERLYQYTNDDGEIIESPMMPPGRDDAVVINRWTDVDGILPRQ